MQANEKFQMQHHHIKNEAALDKHRLQRVAQVDMYSFSIGICMECILSKLSSNTTLLHPTDRNSN